MPCATRWPDGCLPGGWRHPGGDVENGPVAPTAW